MNSKLEWNDDDESKWPNALIAESRFTYSDEGEHMRYRIRKTKHWRYRIRKIKRGRYWIVGETDMDLIPEQAERLRTFSTLKAAQKFCQENEDRMLKDAGVI